MLWLDDKENVGLRLRVVEKGAMEESQSLAFRDEGVGEDERMTSFECVFEEFCVRTGYLVGRIERAKEGESESSKVRELICMG